MTSFTQLVASVSDFYRNNHRVSIILCCSFANQTSDIIDQHEQKIKSQNLMPSWNQAQCKLLFARSRDTAKKPASLFSNLICLHFGFKVLISTSAFGQQDTTSAPIFTSTRMPEWKCQRYRLWAEMNSPAMAEPSWSVLQQLLRGLWSDSETYIWPRAHCILAPLERKWGSYFHCYITSLEK